nr:hypothetical protein [Tanacetum cinerariifolium]
MIGYDKSRENGGGGISGSSVCSVLRGDGGEVLSASVGDSVSDGARKVEGVYRTVRKSAGVEVIIVWFGGGGLWNGNNDSLKFTCLLIKVLCDFKLYIRLDIKEFLSGYVRVVCCKKFHRDF